MCVCVCVCVLYDRITRKQDKYVDNATLNTSKLMQECGGGDGGGGGSISCRVDM